MPEETSTFTTKKHGLASIDSFKWGDGGSPWEDEVNETNGAGMKDGSVTIARPPEAAVTVDATTGEPGLDIFF